MCSRNLRGTIVCTPAVVSSASGRARSTERALEGRRMAAQTGGRCGAKMGGGGRRRGAVRRGAIGEGDSEVKEVTPEGLNRSRAEEMKRGEVVEDAGDKDLRRRGRGTKGVREKKIRKEKRMKEADGRLMLTSRKKRRYEIKRRNQMSAKVKYQERVGKEQHF